MKTKMIQARIQTCGQSKRVGGVVERAELNMFTNTFFATLMLLNSLKSHQQSCEEQTSYLSQSSQTKFVEKNLSFIGFIGFYRIYRILS